MRILLISPFFYPHIGGSQRYMEELHTFLIQSERKIEVDVIAYNTDKSPAKETYQGLTIYRVPCLSILPGQFAVPNFISLLKLIYKLTKSHRYDVVNSNTRFFENSWWTPLLSRIIHAKSVLTDHCASHPVHTSKTITVISGLIDAVVLRCILPKYDKVIVTNKNTQHFLHKKGIYNTQLIYGGVNTKIFRPSGTLKKGEIVITFLGRLIPSKGVDVLLLVAQSLSGKNKNVRFVFAGSGPLADKISASATSQISFAGKLSKAESADLLSKTDIFVFPSRHHEGFPNVLLEAGASGCAIVASSQGGVNEIITHKEDGLLCKPTQEDLGKSINNLIRNKSLRQKYGESIRKKIIVRFDWKAIVPQYRRLLTLLTS